MTLLYCAPGKHASAKRTGSQPRSLLDLGHAFEFTYQLHISTKTQLAEHDNSAMLDNYYTNPSKNWFVPWTSNPRVHQWKTIITALRTLNLLQCAKSMKRVCNLWQEICYQQASKPLTGDARITACILQEEKKLLYPSEETSLWYKWDLIVDLIHQSAGLPYAVSCRLCQLCKLAVKSRKQWLQSPQPEVLKRKI